MERRHPNVANLDEVPPVEGPTAGRFRAQLRGMARVTGGAGLGATFTEVEPGCVAWPFHWHAANEEALIVVAGTGTLRIGDAEIAVRPGDYVTMPTGVPHQLRNTGAETLRYWCLSTKLDPEVVGYPDSGKAGFATSRAPGGPVRSLHLAADAKGYFDGEPDAAGPPKASP